MPNKKCIKFKTIVSGMGMHNETDADWEHEMPVEVTLDNDGVQDVVYKERSVLQHLDWCELAFLLEVAHLPRASRTDLLELDKLRYQMVAHELRDGLAGSMAMRISRNSQQEPENDGTREWLESAFDPDSFLGLSAGVFGTLAKGHDAKKALTPFWKNMKQQMRDWMNDYCGEEHDTKRYEKIQKLKDNIEALVESLDE